MFDNENWLCQWCYTPTAWNVMQPLQMVLFKDINCVGKWLWHIAKEKAAAKGSRKSKIHCLMFPDWMSWLELQQSSCANEAWRWKRNTQCTERRPRTPRFPATLQRSQTNNSSQLTRLFLHDKETNSYWRRHCQLVFNLLADKTFLIIKWGPWAKLDGEIITIIQKILSPTL